VATILVERRGEHNVPRRYLKGAEWHEDKYLGTGYYCSDPDSDDPEALTAVEFNFEALQWGLIEQTGDQYTITRPAPVKYGLRIFDEERTDRSRWGPTDGANPDDEEELLSPPFDLEAKEETPQTPILSSPLVNSNNTQLLHWLNSFPHTLPDPNPLHQRISFACF
jgi:hypothetical protein